MAAYFVSDIHIKSAEDPRAKLFEAWLKSLRHTDCQTLVLLGDIFDLWIGAHEYFTKQYVAIIAAIHDLVRDGVTVHYFEGNHDLYLTQYWQQVVGVNVHADGFAGELESWVVWMEHGDFINPEDRGYKFLRKFLRSDFMVDLEPKLPDGLVAWLGNRASDMSRQFNEGERRTRYPELKVRQMIRSFAKMRAEEKSFHYIITGHVHLTDEIRLETAKGRKYVSINLGSWLDQPKALRLTDKGHEWVSI